MKALVTGGAGFIGSHLVDRLVVEGHAVTVIDDLSTGRMEHVHPRARFQVGMWSGILDDWDWIFHLAARADVVPSIERPEEYFRINVGVTSEMLSIIKRQRTGKLMYAASSSCYGAHPPVPTDESAPIAPAHPYALTKRIAEELVLHYGEVYRIPVVSLRLFNVYGPRARTSGAYGAVMGTFLAQRANGQPLTVVGDGLQQRDFTHVADVVEAFLLAAQSTHTGVYNIGAGRPISILTLARLIGGPKIHIAPRGGEPDVTWADARKARRELGWEATVPIDEGVAQLIEHLDEWKSAPLWTPDSIAEATATWHQTLG